MRETISFREEEINLIVNGLSYDAINFIHAIKTKTKIPIPTQEDNEDEFGNEKEVGTYIYNTYKDMIPELIEKGLIIEATEILHDNSKQYLTLTQLGEEISKRVENIQER